MSKVSFWKNDYVCTVVGLVINAVLMLFKLAAGILAGSQAMIADAMHSFSDEVATFVTLFALKLSQKPEDKEHPYGHGNIEAIASWMVAVLLLITGIYLGYSALHNIIHGHYAAPGKLAVIAAIISIIVKEILFRYTFTLGKELNSPVLKSNAMDHRSDAFSSIGALAGIVGARMGLPILDPITGIVISLFIFKMGIDIIKDSNRILMDAAPDQELLNKWSKTISLTKEVKGSPEIRVHPVGRHYILEAAVRIDGSFTVSNGHKIATAIQDNLTNTHPEIKDVVVHIEPFEE